MRKIIILSLVSSLFIISSSSCAESPPPTLSLGSEQDISIYYCDKSYGCHIQMLGDEVCTVTFTKPQELSGLSFKHSDGEYSLCYNGLCSKNSSPALPRSSLLYMTMEALQSLKNNPPVLQKNNERYTASENAYTLYADEDGRLTELSFS